MHVDLSRHPDYAHLTRLPATGAAFTVDAAVLARLRGLNAFDLPRRHTPGRPVVVGLRGASLARRADLVAEGARIDLVVDRIDHETPRCVILVWRGDRLTAFQGSTVPHVDYLAQQWSRGGQRACLLPTGRYICEIGVHRGRDGAIPRALLLNAKVLVYRANTPDQAHRIGDLDPDWLDPDTNVHAARTDAATHLSRFASAGCLTVPGAVGVAPWTRFVADTAGRVGHRREVIVLTGAEAWAAATRDDTISPTIRPGSLRRRIRAVQKHLGVRADGVFGVSTYQACVERWGVAVPRLD